MPEAHLKRTVNGDRAPRSRRRVMAAASGAAMVGGLLLGGVGLAWTSPAGAAPAGSPTAPTVPAASGPARLTVHNGDSVAGLQITIDGEVRARGVPPGAQIALVLDPGDHQLVVSPVGSDGAAAGRPLMGTVAIDGRSVLVNATASNLSIRAGSAVALASRSVPVLPVQLAAPVLAGRWQGRIPLGPVLASAFGLVLVTGGVIGGLVLGRARVRDERIRLRMQQAALRSLNDLPPLTIGRAARRGAAIADLPSPARAGGAVRSGTVGRTGAPTDGHGAAGAHRDRPKRAGSVAASEKGEFVRGGRVVPTHRHRLDDGHDHDQEHDHRHAHEHDHAFDGALGQGPPMPADRPVEALSGPPARRVDATSLALQ